ncbi:phage tail fiber protein [Escherichia coli]|uniref:phage tail fiber domain-containing protein n=1 Tax=Escherichia coli TaxID=562 RepID=UPI00307AD7A5
MTDVVITPWIDAGDPDGLKYSMNRFQCDGVANVFAISYAGVAPGYLDRSHLKFYIINAADGVKTDPAVVPSGAFQSDTHIKLEQTPGVPYPTGKWVVIYRDTPKSQPIVDFTDGAVINEQNLDTSMEQAVYVAAEMTDRFEEILGSNYEVIDRAAEALSTANTALASAAAANVTAGNAVSSAGAAEDTAAAAVDSAAAANTTAGNAVSTANAATTTANTAKATADGLAASIATANTNASNAVDTANTALTTANGIDAKAQQALDASDGRYNGAITVFSGAGDEWDAGSTAKKGTRAAPGNTKWYLGTSASDGQNYSLRRYDTSGNYIDTPIKVLWSDGTIALGSKRITGVSNGTGAGDAVNKGQLDAVSTVANAAMPRAGGTMTGDLTVAWGSGSILYGAGYMEVFHPSGAYMDFKRNAGSDFEFRLQQTAADRFSITAGGSSVQFTNDGNIYVGKGGWYLFDKMNTKANADWINDVGLQGNDIRRPYVRRASDSQIVALPRVASANAMEFAWDGRLRCYIDGTHVGAILTDNGDQNSNYFHSSSGRVGRQGDWVVSSGYFDVVIDGTSYGVPFNPSDERLKQDIVPAVVSGLDRAKQIAVYSFRFKEGGVMDSEPVYNTGFIAQQLKTVDPTFVNEDKHNPDVMMAPNAGSILATAIKAIQELSAQVDELKAEVAALKGA